MTASHMNDAANTPTRVVGRDRMKLSRMAFFGRHGVFEEERKLGQRWYVDLDLQVDLRQAGLTDDLNESINYALIYEAVKTIMEQESHLLVERLAERIAAMLLGTFSLINEATVRVTKPNPPFDIHFEGVTMEITRARVTGCDDEGA
ncbi:dihydroneopterin aldolase [Paenibacillus marinisediminis]